MSRPIQFQVTPPQLQQLYKELRIGGGINLEGPMSHLKWILTNGDVKVTVVTACDHGGPISLYTVEEILVEKNDQVR